MIRLQVLGCSSIKKWPVLRMNLPVMAVGWNTFMARYLGISVGLTASASAQSRRVGRFSPLERALNHRLSNRILKLIFFSI